jgi:hypothetical protein
MKKDKAELEDREDLFKIGDAMDIWTYTGKSTLVISKSESPML